MAEKRKDASSSWKKRESNNNGASLGGWLRPPRGLTQAGGGPCRAHSLQSADPAPNRTSRRRARGAGTTSARARPARAGPRAASPRAPSARKPEKGCSRARRPGTAKKARGRRSRRAGWGGWGREAGSDASRTPPLVPAQPADPAPQRPRRAPGRRKSLSKAAPPLTRGNEELSGRRRGPGGGLEPRTHVPAVGEHTARARRLGESSAGVEAHPGNSRGRLSNRAKEACCARRQPSSSGARCRPLLIARAAPRVTHRASRRPRSPALGLTQPPPARRAPLGDPDGGTHWPVWRRRPRPQRGACPRGEGQPAPCGLALEPWHRLAL